MRSVAGRSYVIGADWHRRCRFSTAGLRYEELLGFEIERMRSRSSSTLCSSSRTRTTLVGEFEQIYRDGWQAYWRRRLELLSDAASQGYVEPHRFVEISVRLGDYHAAFAWLEKAFERRSSWIPTIAFDPLLDPLRADPRLGELIERARLRPVNPLG
jgi:hypothetical protein